MAETIDFIKSDLFRYTAKTSFLSFVRTYLKNPTFRWQVAFRTVNSNLFFIKLIGGGFGL